MADGLIRTLARLLDEGNVPWSSVSERQRNQLRPLRAADVLTVERSGGGRRLVVQNREMVRQFADQQYPGGLDAARESEEKDHLPASEAALHFRDAKRGSAGGEVVLFRGRAGTEVRCNGASLPIGEMTRKAGVAAVLLEDNTTLTTQNALAVVENQEAFLRFDELGTTAELACFAGGRLSNRMLDWLVSLEVEPGQIIHCPDYDPVGLSEFQRLRNACGEKVRLFWPDRLETLIKKYGKAELYRDSSELLSKLKKVSHPKSQRLLALLQRHGKGLEQEILLSHDS